jgi:glycosyltransferase involved in cell wall biosynthesis
MLTVLFATRNGARTLPGVLDSYLKMSVPAGGWKLIIVDNGSTDSTPDVVKSFENKLPLIYLREPAVGKNRALNKGLDYAEGDLVVLTDDDAYPGENWLAELRKVADTQSTVSIFSGVVLPLWEMPPEDWILRLAPKGVSFSLTDPTQREGPTTADRIFGPNMAIRADVFTKGYRFDASIGPQGINYPMGSESRLVRQLMKDGCTAWHCPGAVVEHFVRAGQLKEEWILKRAVRFGRGQYRLNKAANNAATKWFGVPRYVYRRMIEQWLRVVLACLTFKKEAIFVARWEFNRLRGEYIEAKNMTHEADMTAKTV